MQQPLKKKGKLTITTAYIPPRHILLEYGEYYRLFRKNHPVYFLGDLNARHQCIGNNDNNHRDIMISKLINRGHIQHLGPQFPTFINHRSATKPDIILSNNKTYHHYHLSPGPLTKATYSTGLGVLRCVAD